TMFETSRPNGPPIGAFKASATRPVANSMTADFYRLIPNSIDVTMFAARPWTILNFSVIGNESRYHSPGDTLAALDPASLQHMGRQGLGAALRLAEAGPGASGGGGERLYADVAGRVLIVLPRTLGLALFGLLVAGVAVFAWGRRDGLLRGAGAVIAAVVGSAGLVFVLQWLVGLARPGNYWRAHPDAMALAVDLVALAVSVGALAWIGRGLSRERLRAAFWLVFMVLSLGIVVVAPGAAIFSLIPPLVMLVGWLAGQRARRGETVAALLAWAALFLTWGPLVHLSEVLLDFWSAWLFAPFAALLVLPALIELKPLGAFRPAGLALAGLAAVAAWGAMLALPAYSEDRKQGFRIEYAWDEAAAKGQWLVGNGGVPLPEDFPGRGAFKAAAKLPWTASSRWAALAPAIPLPAPRLERVGERAAPGGRVVAVRVAANGADDVLVRFEGTARIRAFGTAGSTVAFVADAGKEPYLFRCTGRSCDGAVFEIALHAAPAEATAIGIRDVLPAAAAALVRARPATAQAQYSPDASISWTKVPL
ncbi:MAG TPA: M28 family peptidase, partial [Allosphingosinicella sp.]|nr:M28 family peptidase [Allosphingosinicella sp.]